MKHIKIFLTGLIITILLIGGISVLCYLASSFLTEESLKIISTGAIVLILVPLLLFQIYELGKPYYKNEK